MNFINLAANMTRHDSAIVPNLRRVSLTRASMVMTKRKRPALLASAAAALWLVLAQPASAATLTLNAIGAGGIDSDVNGVFDQLVTGPIAYGTGRDVSGAERSWAMEFNLSSLPSGAVINSVILRLRASTGSDVGQSGLSGYSGNGSMSLADMIAGSLLSTFTPANASIFGVDVSPFVTDLVGLNVDWAGFNLRQTPLEAVGSGFGRLWNGPENFPAPSLVIDYTAPTASVPEPASTLLVAMALGGLALVRRRAAHTAAR